MLKPALQLRLGQQLTMTPQLQQAIRLLQLPVLELQAQIREALETNVMLESEDEAGSLETGDTVVEPQFEAAPPRNPPKTAEAEPEVDTPDDQDWSVTVRSPGSPNRRGPAKITRRIFPTPAAKRCRNT